MKRDFLFSDLRQASFLGISVLCEGKGRFIGLGTIEIWQAWSACSKECGQGESTRKRELVTSSQPPDNGVLYSGVLSHLDATLGC